MAQVKYFLAVEDRVPAKTAVVYQRGAIVNGAQASVNTVVVHSPHGYATDDKFLFAPTRDNVRMSRVFTVSGTAATSVTFSGSAFSFPDKALLVPLSADTGGSANADGSFQLPNYDGSDETIYKDPAGDDAYTNANVAISASGEVDFYGTGSAVWVLILDGGNRVQRVYVDLGGGGGGASSGTSLPATGDTGEFFVLTSADTDTGDRLYVWMELGDATADWIEITQAPAS